MISAATHRVDAAAPGRRYWLALNWSVQSTNTSLSVAEPFPRIQSDRRACAGAKVRSRERVQFRTAPSSCCGAILFSFVSLSSHTLTRLIMRTPCLYVLRVNVSAVFIIHAGGAFTGVLALYGVCGRKRQNATCNIFIYAQGSAEYGLLLKGKRRCTPQVLFSYAPGHFAANNFTHHGCLPAIVSSLV